MFRSLVKIKVVDDMPEVLHAINLSSHKIFFISFFSFFLFKFRKKSLQLKEPHHRSYFKKKYKKEKKIKNTISWNKQLHIRLESGTEGT